MSKIDNKIDEINSKDMRIKMHYPIRTCVGCKEKKDPKSMYRISFDGNNLRLNTKEKEDGRGAYLCKNNLCLEKMIKSKALKRSFRTNLKTSDIDLVEQKLKEEIIRESKKKKIDKIDKKDIYKYLGLASKSRNLVSGTNTLLAYLDKNKIKLVIIAKDISLNTKDKILGKCKKYRIPYMIFGDSFALSKATGSHSKGVFGITDKNLAKEISKIYKNT